MVCLSAQPFCQMNVIANMVNCKGVSGNLCGEPLLKRFFDRQSGTVLALLAS
ncbi:hypothetical protein CP97_01230 [Aurantiacibacter atlanticus]|uniref:Uncharacterized protein n=1 Tax=Aurantiacibacter atlanticus TaxID=1648404 RepID=A0A0H4V8N2_9SPHN|nr:hypothetical protein CP97_01230 [Aurantiacibacter atlanticus]